MQAHFIKLDWENAAHTIGTIYMRPIRPYYFTPGQYAEIGAPTVMGPVARTMTLTTLPSDKLVGFTTRFDRHHGTYKQALLGLQAGDVLTITDAMGDLVLPLDSSVPLVFVAGGVAIASYVSMIRWLTEQGDARTVSLFYAVRSPADVIYTEVFDAYSSVGHLTRILHLPSANATLNWAGKVSNTRLSAAEVMQHVTPESQIYLSGAESMVEQLRQELQKDYKIPQYRLVFDFFDGYSSKI